MNENQHQKGKGRSGDGYTIAVDYTEKPVVSCFSCSFGEPIMEEMLHFASNIETRLQKLEDTIKYNKMNYDEFLGTLESGIILNHEAIGGVRECIDNIISGLYQFGEHFVEKNQHNTVHEGLNYEISHLYNESVSTQKQIDKLCDKLKFPMMSVTIVVLGLLAVYGMIT